VSLFDFFFPKKPQVLDRSASVARERLQIVLAHERAGRDSPDFLPRLQRDLLAVVAKYMPVEDDLLQVKLSRAGNASVLEINVEIPRGLKTPTGPMKVMPA
jgi:cell division topological specificity factor